MLIVLGSPRSFTTVISAMLGQHPQMYGFPDMHLFTAETIGEWWERSERTRPTLPHGALRAIAELIFGEQTERNVLRAQGWLRRRGHFTTGFLLELLSAEVSPRIPVLKGPIIPKSIDRVLRMFPDASFVHVVRHPRGNGQSVMDLLEDRSQTDYPPRWLLRLASNKKISKRKYLRWRELLDLDPQLAWYRHNSNICRFLEPIPETKRTRICSENFIANANEELQRIALWMGVRSDPEAIDEMKHPERSPFASIGPRGAGAGGDLLFLANPVLRPERVEQLSLRGPLSWRADGLGFLPEVKRLARQFGYE